MLSGQVRAAADTEPGWIPFSPSAQTPRDHARRAGQWVTQPVAL